MKTAIHQNMTIEEIIAFKKELEEDYEEKTPEYKKVNPRRPIYDEQVDILILTNSEYKHKRICDAIRNARKEEESTLRYANAQNVCDALQFRADPRIFVVDYNVDTYFSVNAPFLSLGPTLAAYYKQKRHAQIAIVSNLFTNFSMDMKRDMGELLGLNCFTEDELGIVELGKYVASIIN